MTDLATLQARLAEAEEAYHRLQCGEKRVAFSRAGTSMSWTAAQAPELRRYIGELKDKIARGGGGGLPRSAITPIF